MMARDRDDVVLGYLPTQCFMQQGATGPVEKWLILLRDGGRRSEECEGENRHCRETHEGRPPTVARIPFVGSISLNVGRS